MEKTRSGLKQIFSIYWPLAISWIFMAVDVPAITAFVSRMQDSENCLAAYGGVNHPILMLVEFPIVMLLSTSIALCKDHKNYLRIRKLMLTLITATTLISALVCVPPVFELVVMKIVGAPEALRHYSLKGLLLLIPWTGAIGFRRFYQGILIRYGESKKVTIGTCVRFVVMIATLTTCYCLRDYVDGSSTASLASSLSVLSEAVFAGLQAKSVVKKNLSADDDKIPLIGEKELFDFVTPLSLTALVDCVWVFIGGACVNRMPNPIISLAVWPVITGILDLLKCFGSALNETSLAAFVSTELRKEMKKFVFCIVGFSFFLYTLLLIPAFGKFWFLSVASISQNMLTVARHGYPLVFMVPLTWGIYNYYSAVLVDAHYTRPVFESLLVYLGGMLLVTAIGVVSQRWYGVYVVLTGASFGSLLQTLWISFRANRRIQENA